MAAEVPAFTLGVEEEYLLVDLKTRDLCPDPPKSFMAACEAALPKRVAPEFLRCQIEVGTPVCGNAAEARAHLSHLRGTIARLAGEHGLAPIAVSTHPFAQWASQQHTDKERYHALARDMQIIIRRMLICGMHVHVGIEDEALRHDIFGQAVYFLPHLLALSASSPFWQGHETGLKSYRLSVFSEMPRTGLPDAFGSERDYRHTIEALVETGLVDDPTKVWWDMRPSHRFPTLEMRITDCCTRLDDAIAIAALFQCLCRMLWRLRLRNQRWRAYPRVLVEENRWLAQKHGPTGELADFGRKALVPYPELLEEIIDLVREDAEHFGCLGEVEHARRIPADGSSADRQIRIFHAARADGADQHEALRAVVDHLVQETVASCSSRARSPA
ncbi:carboxylate-amine ligase [Lutibaculum baratangense]|uniref:Putative glutamate--cysteine ligase 2 n=1 Tax=Lutibaculum baratangense AMV1 TaxID=631454 RepID=V4QT41_9HYPH|nr:carboxylate-amine ligase [Lutibaculum baratangense]ESR22897.1 Carboxylate-amine ligase [Lutibaculum baratangense AMV1]